MSLSNLLRRHVHSATVFCRYRSSSATNHRPQRILPDEKLRALVSLYHQADSFITLENLSQRIDDAFTGTMDHAEIVGGNLKTLEGIDVLKAALDRQREQARVTEWDSDTARSYTAMDHSHYGWSGSQRGRELMVKQALYGLSSDGENAPGLDILKDAVGKGGRLSEKLENEVRMVRKFDSVQNRKGSSSKA